MERAKEISALSKKAFGSLNFWLTHLGFMLLLLAAVYYHQERVFGSDPSSYLVGIIESGWFFTYNWRISIWLSQWLPLIAIWLGLSMKAILIAHSIGNVINFYAAYLLGRCVFRKTYAGGVMLLLQTLGVSFCYFAWPYGEVQYGVCLIIILYWLITSDGFKSAHWPVVWALLAFIIGSHPLVWVVLLFALVMLVPQERFSHRVWGSLISFAVLLFGKLLFVPSYDASLIHDLLDRQPLFQYVDFVGFWRMVLSNMATFSMVGALSVYTAYQRNWWLLLNIVISCTAITLIIGNYMPLAEATQQYYLAFSAVFIVGLMYSIDRAPSGPTSSLVSTATIIFAGICFFPIWVLGNTLKLRTQGLTELLAECGNLPQQRFVINGYNLYKDRHSGVYPDTYEELLLLSALGPRPVQIHVYEKALECYTGTAAFKPDGPRKNRKVYSIRPSSQDSLISILKNQNLRPNPDFFGRMSGSYAILNTMATNDPFVFDSLSVTITKESSNWPSSTTGLRVFFKNRSGQIVYSGLTENINYTISYISKTDTILKTIPLRSDIHSSSEETVILHPAEGTLKIIFEIVGRNGVLATKKIRL